MTRHRPVTASRLVRIDAQLTSADRAVLETLRKLRVATGLQLQYLHHGTDEAAMQRRVRQLTRLSRMQVVTRLQRRLPGGPGGGASPSVYALDVAGLRLIDQSGNARKPWQPSTPFVAHAVAVSQSYVDLVTAERAGLLELLRFDAEPRCWRSYVDEAGERLTLKPDADVVVAVDDWETHAWLEIDLATESRPRITRMAQEYVSYLRTGIEQTERGVTPKVMFVVPTERRQELVGDAVHRVDRSFWHLFAVCLAGDLAHDLTEEVHV